jgi:integrase
VGLIDPTTEQVKRPLEDHISEYEAKLKAAHRKPKHIKTTLLYIRSIANASNWGTAAEIQARPVVQFVGRLQDKKQSARTVQAYLTAIKGFTKWLTKEERLPRDPLTSISKHDPKADRKRERRMLLPDEWPWLRSATLAGPDRFGMLPAERMLLYAVGIQTGLRSNELRSLKRGQLFLEAETPFITCKAQSTKNSKPARQYITADLAEELKAFIATKAPQAPVFTMPESWDVADMLREDVAAARKSWLATFKHNPAEYQRQEQSDFLTPVNHDGEALDFHSLRHTCGAWLAMTGAHPNAVKAVLRHSTITLTMDTYGHLFPGQEADTVARFPDMMNKEAMSATGTDGKHVGQHVGTSYMLPHQSAPIRIRNDDCSGEDGLLEVVKPSSLSIGLHRTASKEESAPSRTRTLNPLIKSQLLCQLS